MPSIQTATPANSDDRGSNESGSGLADATGDGELLARWHASRDPLAFAELVRAHEAALLHHAIGLVGDRARAEDVVQEVFLKLAQKPPVLPEEVAGDMDRERAQLRSWLHRVTRNACMDSLRTEKRRRRREEEVAGAEATVGGMERVEEADTRAAVERGIERLPDDQREVVVLRLISERSYREIAEITGKKVGTVGWLISEGLRALSQDLSHLVPAGTNQRG
ncbi:ECF RNA polymerase sigma factor SigW [Planctomycetes bacterium Pla163]|uniref:ECF RNA polymerase sigma factor SigW n=1 Tax=Rohdeia mirabilis TaxID=2528008 RepID=A0A518D4N1_9BACT|nr:ECF RNA polymerase sigma factor SigW [Planctomycetes bacterium Pla163]